MEKISPLIISVTGWSGSGKTTFCEKLIIELRSRGIKIAAAKNSHRSIETDKAGSDSRRFFEAGADAVCLNAENSMTLFFQKPLDSGNRLAAIFPDVDIIIAEGFKAKDALKIEVTGLIETADEMKNPEAEADMIIYGSSKPPELMTPGQPRKSIPVYFQRDNIKAAADFICSRT